MVDAARMRRNLDRTGGLIMAEAVMMGLAPALGRGEAHHVVHHACDVALEPGHHAGRGAAARAARRREARRARRSTRMTDPAGYLGAAAAFVDRVLARVG